MRVKKLTLFIPIIFSACASQTTFRQAGSDNLSAAIESGKAVVVIEASANIKYIERVKANLDGGLMMVGFALLTPGTTQKSLYESKNWEFATYPGAAIPFYAGEQPYGLHAYFLEPGTYAAVRCVYGAPELDYCPAGYWTNNNSPVGVVYFKVEVGEVINTGKMQVIRNVVPFKDSTYEVSIINNNEEASKYLEKNLPSLAKKLQYRPYQFTN